VERKEVPGKKLQQEVNEMVKDKMETPDIGKVILL
jgi:hypothetical protein